jgi:hypothetical protein
MMPLRADHEEEEKEKVRGVISLSLGLGLGLLWARIARPGGTLAWDSAGWGFGWGARGLAT